MKWRGRDVPDCLQLVAALLAKGVVISAESRPSSSSEPGASEDIDMVSKEKRRADQPGSVSEGLFAG